MIELRPTPNWEWLQYATEKLLYGDTEKMTFSTKQFSMSVYKVGSVIRIDIKKEGQQ